MKKDWKTEWCFRPQLCTKAKLGRTQPGKRLEEDYRTFTERLQKMTEKSEHNHNIITSIYHLLVLIINSTQILTKTVSGSVSSQHHNQYLPFTGPNYKQHSNTDKNSI